MASTATSRCSRFRVRPASANPPAVSASRPPHAVARPVAQAPAAQASAPVRVVSRPLESVAAKAEQPGRARAEETDQEASRDIGRKGSERSASPVQRQRQRIPRHAANTATQKHHQKLFHDATILNSLSTTLTVSVIATPLMRLMDLRILAVGLPGRRELPGQEGELRRLGLG